MHDRLKPLAEKWKYLAGSILLLFVFVICVALITEDGDDFDVARREVSLRRIGHELLLQAGDSTSRVLPVQKIAGNEYQIRFENNLTFQPDSLMNITQRLLANDPLASEYIVNVLNSRSPGVFYGFAVSKNKENSIVSCSKRIQPKASYIINIKFKSAEIYTAKNGYLLGGLPLLAFVGFIFLRSVKPRKALPKSQNDRIITLGSVLFDAEDKNLVINGQKIDLTGTETRVLRIFAISPNKTIERSRLQKEIWEDEGVIVGRSLDMFISKLRKKLECDPNIKIVVIRGKGYKLNISA